MILNNISLEHIQRGGKFGGIHLNERGVDVFKQSFIDLINFWYENAYTRALSAQKPILTPVKLNENLEVLQNTAEEDCTKDAKTLISDYRAKNCDKVVIATLNLNSLPNKFSSLAEIISNNIDILVIEETKIDESFPEGQFLIPGYKKPYRKDRNRNGGGIIVYVREDIPSRKLDQCKLDDAIRGIFIEINLRKSKWLMIFF